MRHLLFIFFAVFLIVIYNGCESPSGSKPISTSPPVLVYPYDNDSNVTTMTTFRWKGTADIIWLDVNSSFSNPVTYTVSDTSYSVIDPLSANSSYYWKAGRTIGGTIYWSSDYYYFRTGSN